MALISCQEATGLVPMCVVICMSNKNEMQTNFPAGLSSPLSCYLFGSGDNTFFPAARVTTGLQKRATVLSAHGPCVDHLEFGAGLDAMKGMGGCCEARAVCLAVACRSVRLALRPLCCWLAMGLHWCADTQSQASYI